MNRSFIFPLLCLLAVAGCSGSTANQADDVVLIPTKSVYAPGETVSAQLFNRSEEPVGYGACSTRLEHLAGSQWVLIGSEQEFCIGVLYTLDAAGTLTRQLQLDQTLESGTYRLRQEILPQLRLPTRNIYSPEFRVRNAA